MDKEHPAAAARLRVLVIEDNEINQEILVSMLDALGHAWVIATDGAQGVERYREQRFDLILMDWLMPVMDGLAATRAIRDQEERADSAAARTPIIVVSASAMNNEVEQCLAAGADAHLAKPFRRAQLDATIRQVVVPG